jgi:hypothetical protein
VVRSRTCAIYHMVYMNQPQDSTFSLSLSLSLTHTHTHIHTPTYTRKQTQVARGTLDTNVGALLVSRLLEEEDTDEDMEDEKGCGKRQGPEDWAEAEGVVKDEGVVNDLRVKGLGLRDEEVVNDLVRDCVAMQQDQGQELSNN